MHALPIFFAIGLLLLQGIAEGLAMWRTGSLRRKWTPEWTFQAVNLPYRMMVVAGVAEYLLTNHKPTSIGILCGVVLALAGIAIRTVCHFQLGARFSPYVELADEHTLIQAGLYRHLRHPMYFGTLLIAVGLPLVMGSAWAAGCAVLVVVGLLFRISKEEQLLRQHLPGYNAYAARTWRLIPCVW